MLSECGVSRAALQNMHGIGESKVVPFTRFIGVEFGEQLPEGVTEQSIIEPFLFSVRKVENLLRVAA
jgi:II/X family phage/plasmid replication protein